MDNDEDYACDGWIYDETTGYWIEDVKVVAEVGDEKIENTEMGVEPIHNKVEEETLDYTVEGTQQISGIEVEGEKTKCDNVVVDLIEKTDEEGKQDEYTIKEKQVEITVVKVDQIDDKHVKPLIDNTIKNGDN